MQPLSQAQGDLVERFGVLHDRMGMPPAAGRIIGLLIVVPGGLTFDEIRESLGLSKSSTSTALQLLQSIGSVVYRTRSGERKRYFYKNIDDWEARFVRRFTSYLEIRHLLAEALEQRADADPDANVALARITDFLYTLADSIEETLTRWTRERANEARTPPSPVND